VLDGLARVFDDPDPTAAAGSKPGSSAANTAKRSHGSATSHHPSVQHAKLVFLRRAAVANELLARRRAEDRYA
jgi:hypothetical protein